LDEERRVEITGLGDEGAPTDRADAGFSFTFAPQREAAGRSGRLPRSC
jgi:hypothetical protein